MIPHTKNSHLSSVFVCTFVKPQEIKFKACRFSFKCFLCQACYLFDTASYDLSAKPSFDKLLYILRIVVHQASPDNSVCSQSERSIPSYNLHQNLVCRCLFSTTFTIDFSCEETVKKTDCCPNDSFSIVPTLLFLNLSCNSAYYKKIHA